MKKRVACYCRVSTDSKEQESSLENQESYFDDKIAEKEEYTLFRVYSDKGTSGTKLEREGFNKMLVDAGLDCEPVQSKSTSKKKFVWIASEREAMFDYIWVKNTSRFARNVLAMDIIRELESKHVYVKFLDIDKSTENSADIFLIQLLQTLDEEESRSKSRKVKIGLEQSAKRGKLLINDNIYGYKYDSKTKELTVREDEAAVIREIFKMYSEGIGTRRIAKYLEDNNKRSRKGIPFSYSTIKCILKNIRYAGFNVYNKYDRSGVFDTEKHATMRQFDEWKIEKSDKIEAIISEELYYKCKAILESKKSHINNKGINRGKGEFAGLIYCAKCGKTYNQTAAHGKRLFMCSTKKKHGTKACNNVNISYEKMLEAVTSDEYSAKLFFWKGWHGKHLHKLVTRLQDKLTSSNAAEIEDCKNRLAEHKRTRDKIMDLWKRRLYTDNELETELAPITPEIIRLEEALAFYAKTNEDIENDIAEVNKTADALRAFEVKEHYTHKEILNDIAKITVYADGGIDFICKAQHTMVEIRRKHGELFRVLNEEQ